MSRTNNGNIQGIKMNVTTMNNQTTPVINAKPIDKPIALATDTAATTNVTANENTAASTQANISNEGAVASYLASLNPQQQAEVEEFMAQLHQQKASGSFDAKISASQAPDSINELSSILNVSTEDLLSHVPTEASPDIQLGGSAQYDSPAIKTYMAVSQQNQTAMYA